MKKTFILILGFILSLGVEAVDLKHCEILVSQSDHPLVAKMAQVLSADIHRVTGSAPVVSARVGDKPVVVLSTVDGLAHLPKEVQVSADAIRGGWEQFIICTRGNRLIIVGSDPRGLAYGVFHVSERIGVNPWYWWADVPVVRQEKLDYKENFTSQSPTVKYRGIFINDEDWGLKTWSSFNYEKELGDIGPKTYDRVCELILRLRGNMLAPAMHTCTGAFYSHPESQQRAAEWGIMITTSHCEPMLFNNASPTEWSRERDGEWNYLTNKQTIWKKFDDRLRETAQYDNIYTMGMRGLHDEAMKGSTDNSVRARTLEQVMEDQRQILVNHKRRPATEIPQIFVPYKETLDIYDAGLRVPDDITLVWPDDNYGYMKRVSNEVERQRKGGSGVYYHLSYLGTPHDNLWICTTPPTLMYSELRKAYDSGADRYWLLNVGDIKPMELGMQLFFDMAWNLSAFSYDNVNSYQAEWLASVYGKKYKRDFQQILDDYYRLAWDRKPEFMGYEIEWDSDENTRMHDSDFSFEKGTWQKRLDDYGRIAAQYDAVEKSLPASFRPSCFEVLGFAVKASTQMNRKFLMAQRNHETGSADAARESREAFDSINALMLQYNTQLDGKWNQMMSQIPPVYQAKHHLMPELVSAPTTAYQLPNEQLHPEFDAMIALDAAKVKAPFRLVEGMGTDWRTLLLGNPMDKAEDPASLGSTHIDLPFCHEASADTLRLCVSVVPFWPVATDCSNRFGVSLDGCAPVVCENTFTEWSPEWKLQVLENRKEFVLSLPIDKARKRHTLTLVVGDPGQMIQKITYQP